MHLELDHVPIAVSDLDAATDAMTDLGLEPVYGGEHRNGVTHMSVVGFEDRSYVELIARHGSGESPFWPRFVHEGLGPCAWCVRVKDLHAESARLVERGVGISGPWNDGRERPDGLAIEWDATFLGEESWRNALPFLIADRTPIERRVPVTVSGGSLTGIETVVVAVSDLEAATVRFRRTFRLPRPEPVESDLLGTELVRFPGRPVVLAAPGDGGGPVGERLDRLPQAPCACLLGTDDFEGVTERFPLEGVERWGERRVAWFEGEAFSGELGVIER